LDSSNNVDIAAVKSKFVAKAPANSVWVDLIGTAVDSCWADAKSTNNIFTEVSSVTNAIADAPAPTPPPGAPAPPADKRECKHHALLLMQCVQRNLIIV